MTQKYNLEVESNHEHAKDDNFWLLVHVRHGEMVDTQMWVRNEITIFFILAFMFGVMVGVWLL